MYTVEPFLKDTPEIRTPPETPPSAYQVEDHVQQVFQEVLGLPRVAGGDDGVSLQGVPVGLRESGGR